MNEERLRRMREYSRLRYQEQKEENEMYKYFRDMFHTCDDVYPYQFASQEPERLRVYIRGYMQEYRAKKYYSTYYDGDPVECVRKLF